MSVMRWPIRRFSVPSIGTRRILGTVALVAGILTIASCGDGGTSTLQTQVATLQTRVAQDSLFQATAAAAPDRVVGIEFVCMEGAATGTQTERWGQLCTSAGTPFPLYPDESIAILGAPINGTLYNRRQVLTVRTSSGSTYTIAVALTQQVKLGDPWPPPP